jgi:hypothetical protein
MGARYGGGKYIEQTVSRRCLYSEPAFVYTVALRVNDTGAHGDVIRRHDMLRWVVCAAGAARGAYHLDACRWRKTVLSHVQSRERTR